MSTIFLSAFIDFLNSPLPVDSIRNVIALILSLAFPVASTALVLFFMFGCFGDIIIKDSKKIRKERQEVLKWEKELLEKEKKIDNYKKNRYNKS